MMLSNQIKFYGANETLKSTLTGISDSIGDSSTIAVSQKCLKDNYLPLSGGTMTGDLKVNSGVYVNNTFYICKDGVAPSPVGGIIYTDWDSSFGPIFRVRKTDSGVSLSAENGGTIEFGVGMVKSKLTGISDSKGTSSTTAVSQKCLNDNYIPFDNIPTLKRHLDIPIGTYSVIFTNSTGNGNSVSINGNRIDVSDNTNEQTLTINQSNISYGNSNGESWTFSGISDSKGTSSTIAASQKCLSDNYLALSGGTITGDTTVMGSTGQYGIKFTNGDIQFLSDGGATVGGTITGISSSKGTSTTRAISEKGVADNYLAKSDISNTTGTDTTKVPSLKCLNDNYLPLSGGSVNGTLNAESLNVNETALLLGGANIQSNTDIYGHLKIKTDDGTEYLTLSQNSIQYSNTNTNINWTFAGTVFSTTDLTAGTSALSDNQLYFVYE